MKDFIVDPATKFSFQPADFVPFKDREVCEKLRSCDINTLTPLEALNLIFELKKILSQS